MTEARQPNCIGHAFYIARINSYEIYQSPPYLGELENWFEFAHSIEDLLIIAILRGEKLNPHPKDEVEHMIARVGFSNIFSHRPYEGAEVETGPASKLLANYKNDLGTYYQKYLTVK